MAPSILTGTWSVARNNIDATQSAPSCHSLILLIVVVSILVESTHLQNSVAVQKSTRTVPRIARKSNNTYFHCGPPSSVHTSILI